MDYQKFTIPATAEQQEILIALLAEHPFDSFLEGEKALEAFIPENQCTPETVDTLKQIAQSLGLDAVQEKIPYQNWNKTWEENFDPIAIPEKCLVRAPFHPKQAGFVHEIILQPQMAFGTGHHATTYLVMDQMFSIDFQGKKVLDYGCGTGILAILASKLGANSIDAIDIDPLSYENSGENLQVNEIGNVNCHLGTLEKLVENKYDIILANINRNVLLESGATLSQQLLSGGILLVSGLLEKDETIICESYEAEGFTKINTRRRNGWICIEFQLAKDQRNI